MTENKEGVQEKLAELAKLFRDRIERDDVQQRAFNQLYEELRQYKEDFVFQLENRFFWICSFFMTV